MQAVSGTGPVLLFDSGVGGLSVVSEIRMLLPDVPLAYVADNGFFPYGGRPAEMLVERVVRVFTAAIAVEQPRLLVVACNTASTLALAALRQALTIPVVGVVPAIKPAALLSKRRIIGLLGTERTVAARYTAGLIAAFAPDCRIVAVGSPALVRLAEKALHGEPPDATAIADELAAFRTPDPPDVVVLACTHFPLLRAELIRALPEGVAVIDSGSAIARRVAHLLRNGKPAPSRGEGHPEYFHLTADPADLRRARRAFEPFGFSPGRILSV